MNFYRVCHSYITDDDGYYIGPYRLNDQYRKEFEVYEIPHNDSRMNYYGLISHQWPVEINGQKYYWGDFLCGFSSIRDLRKWFPAKVLLKLRENKFVVRKYQLNHIVNGEEQAFALIDDIVRLENPQKFELI